MPKIHRVPSSWCRGRRRRRRRRRRHRRCRFPAHQKKPAATEAQGLPTVRWSAARTYPMNVLAICARPFV